MYVISLKLICFDYIMNHILKKHCPIHKKYILVHQLDLPKSLKEEMIIELDKYFGVYFPTDYLKLQSNFN